MNERSRLQSRDKYPCKDCAKRHPGCHAICPDMAAAKKRAEKRKAAESSRRQTDNDYWGLRSEAWLRAQRKKQKER